MLSSNPFRLHGPRLGGFRCIILGFKLVYFQTFFGRTRFDKENSLGLRELLYQKSTVGPGGLKRMFGGDVDFKILDVNTEENARKAMPNATPNHRSKSDETPLP